MVETCSWRFALATESFALLTQKSCMIDRDMRFTAVVVDNTCIVKNLAAFQSFRATLSQI